MGIDISRHLGEGPSRHPSLDVPVDGTLLLRGPYHTPQRRLGACAIVRWTALWGTQWGQLDGRCARVSLAPRRAAVGTVGLGRACTPGPGTPSQ
jgi:hypothetical protein